MSNTETQFTSLDPWYYQVEIDGKKVKPGVGSKQSAKELIDRQKYREKMLLKPILIRYDFKGKSIFDLACNCAYWSNEYIKAGATFVRGIEGRQEYVEQARLYHASERRKDGLDAKSEFWRRNVDGHIAELLFMGQEDRKYDFTMLCGILYHVNDYRELLRRACSLTNDAVLVDTRISQDEKKILEPGGWFFDGVGEKVVKVNPSRDGLYDVLTEQGFSRIIQVPSAGPVPSEMKVNDDYDAGKRITLLARRP